MTASWGLGVVLDAVGEKKKHCPPLFIVNVYYYYYYILRSIYIIIIFRGVDSASFFLQVPGLPDQTKHEAVEGLAVAAVAATWTQQVDLEKLAAASRTRKNAHAVMIGTQPSAALKAVQVQTAKLCTEPEPRNEHVYKLVAVVTERLQQLGGINSGRSSDGLRVNLAAEDMVDAVALAMSSDFTGRGIGEKPTTKVDLGEASASMHQLVVGVE